MWHRRLGTAVAWQPEGVRSRRLSLLGGAVIGGLVAFLFDPRLGRGRRTYLRDRTVGVVHRRAKRTRRFGRMIGSYGRGYLARLFHRHPADRLQPDDATLAHKVETELFRPADVPKGQININVQNGVVQLRGEVPQPEMIHDLGQRARHIAGVLEVENLLHLPGTPAPMHE
jgi:BON domain